MSAVWNAEAFAKGIMEELWTLVQLPEFILFVLADTEK